MSCEEKTKSSGVASFVVLGEKDSKKTQINPVSMIPSHDEIVEKLEEAKINLETNSYTKIGEIKLLKSELSISDKASAIGKKIYVINNESFGPPSKDRIAGVTIGAGNNTIVDLFRVFAGKYWTVTDDDKYLIYLNTEKGSSFKILDYNFTGKGVVKPQNIEKIGILKDKINTQLDGLFKSKIQSQDDIFFGTQQWILIQAEKSRFLRTERNSNNTSPTVFESRAIGNMSPFLNQNGEYNFVFNQGLWEVFIKGGSGQNGELFSPAIQQGVEYVDFCFELPIPFSKKELIKYSGINNPISADIETDYNFYIEDYEKVLPDIPEPLIPNLYTMMSELSQESNKIEFQDLISLAGTINLKEVNSNIQSSYYSRFAREYKKIKRVDKKEVEERIRIDKIDRLNKLSKKNTNIIVPLSNIELLKNFNDKKYLFPMFTNISFSTDRTTVFAQILKDTNLSSLVLNKVVAGINDIEKPDFNKVIEAKELLEMFKTVDGENIKKSFSFQKNDRRVWDISGLLKQIDDQDDIVSGASNIFSSNQDISVFLGKNDENFINNANNKFFRNILKIIFVGKLRKLIKERFRTYEEVLKGKIAYSETVLYRVEKSSGNQVLQNFYFPNSNEIDVVEFIDTQVKYNKEYTYNIYAYQAVVGNKYSYTNIETNGELASFLVTQAPHVVLVEVPYYSFVGTVIDDPPVFPEIDIVPYRAVNDRLIFMLRSNTGEYFLDPIEIEDGDKEKINEIRKAKNLDDKEKIKYTTDDHNTIYQIYRTEVKPSSYKDFSGKLIKTVYTDINQITPQKATSATYIDKVKPNTKYYYVVRAIDNHNHMSNPTEVFEVEIVDDGGSIYPIINVVDFKKEKNIITKSGKKYILIRPALKQSLINEQRSGFDKTESAKEIQGVILGVADRSIWGETYKIRLTSKKTGKRIDLNVVFNSKTKKIDEE